MPRGKKAPVEDRMVEGYNPNWIKAIGPEHPDFKKIMKAARKKKFIK